MDPPAGGGGRPLIRIAICLEYDGTCFEGWQTQRGGRTVQGVVEGVLAGLCHRTVRVTGSGRTDAGVHARRQVAHLDLEPEEVDRVICGLPALLPADVACTSASEAAPGFHARFSARSRTYRYRLIDHRSPLEGRFALEMPGVALDTPAMREACVPCTGRRDWRGMARTGGGNSTWTVDVAEARVDRDPAGWTFTIRADRFLRGMVRIWAGTLVETGRGRFGPGRLEEILSTGDRRLAGPSLPARGLVLEDVSYDGGVLDGQARS